MPQPFNSRNLSFKSYYAPLVHLNYSLRKSFPIHNYILYFRYSTVEEHYKEWNYLSFSKYNILDDLLPPGFLF